MDYWQKWSNDLGERIIDECYEIKGKLNVVRCTIVSATERNKQNPFGSGEKCATKWWIMVNSCLKAQSKNA